MPAPNKQRQLIICGFHRSGTSLTMQAMHNAGLRIGDHLVAATPANPDGHFEDRHIVTLHNDILAAHHRHWDSPGCAITDIADSFSQRALEIIAQYDAAPSSWGFKDPRTCLFLDWWESMLARPGAILIYRDYLSCFNSLRNRQAQQIALNPRFHQKSTGFWSDPTLALRLWLDHNLSILAYIKNNPDNSILVSHGAMLEGFDLVSAANEHFDISLDVSKPSGIRLQKVDKRSPLRLASEIPGELLKALDNTQEELDELAMATTRHPMQWIYSAGTPGKTPFEQTLTALTRAAGIPDSEGSTLDVTQHSTQAPDNRGTARHQIKGDESVEQLVQQLQNSIKFDDPDVSRALVASIMEHHATDITLLINVSKTLIALNDFADAEHYLLIARQRAPANIQILIQLALLARQRGEYGKASLILQAAYTMKAPSATLMAHLGRCLLQADRWHAALTVVKDGLIRFPDNLPLSVLEIKLLMNNKDYERALDSCYTTLSLDETDHVVIGLLGDCLQQLGKVDDAHIAHNDATLMRLRKLTNYHRLLDSAISVIKSDAERQAMQERIIIELGNLVSANDKDESDAHPTRLLDEKRSIAAMANAPNSINPSASQVPESVSDGHHQS